MTLESFLSVTTLAVVIWVMRFLPPRAVKDRDPMAITCALLTTVIALLLWFLIGTSILQ
jgi:hypothetical protein